MIREAPRSTARAPPGPSGEGRPKQQGAIANADGYSRAVPDRALALREEGYSLAQTATRLRQEVPEAEHITKDTLASLLRRHAQRPGEDVLGPQGLDRRTVGYVHTILHRAFKDAVGGAGFHGTRPTPPTRPGRAIRQATFRPGMP